MLVLLAEVCQSGTFACFMLLTLNHNDIVVLACSPYLLAWFDSDSPCVIVFL
jgi:hypothetical protein